MTGWIILGVIVLLVIALVNWFVSTQRQLVNLDELDAIKPGQKVLLVDDLMATGGTIEAMIKLVEKLGGEVAGVAVLMELKGLNGRERIKNYRLDAAISYEGK